MADPALWLMPGYPLDWGEPEQIYRQAGPSKAMKLLGLSGLLLLTFVIPYAGYRLVAGSPAPWTTSIDTICLASFFALQIFLVVCITIPARRRIKLEESQRGDMAVVCIEGVASYHEGAWSQAKWDEIAEVTVLGKVIGKQLMTFDKLTDIFVILPMTAAVIWKLFGGDRPNYVITTKTQDEVYLGGTLKDVDRLVETIRERLLSLRLSSAQQRLLAGEELRFGRVVISEAGGIRVGEKGYAWKETGAVSLEEKGLIPSIDEEGPKILKIKPRVDLPGKEIQVPEEDVADVDLLIALAASRVSGY